MQISLLRSLLSLFWSSLPLNYDQTKEVVVLKVQPLANLAKKTALRYDVTHFILAIAVSIIVCAFTFSVLLYSVIYYFTIPVSVQQ